MPTLASPYQPWPDAHVYLLLPAHRISHQPNLVYGGCCRGPVARGVLASASATQGLPVRRWIIGRVRSTSMTAPPARRAVPPSFRSSDLPLDCPAGRPFVSPVMEPASARRLSRPRRSRASRAVLLPTRPSAPAARTFARPLARPPARPARPAFRQFSRTLATALFRSAFAPVRCFSRSSVCPADADRWPSGPHGPETTDRVDLRPVARFNGFISTRCRRGTAAVRPVDGRSRWNMDGARAGGT